ncbi:MAG: glycosyltransferase family 2 protein [Anaerolineaceae bacterium]|nr:glycosyltransferase family 2 protein [Anaerolineaceae bacterium]
MAEIKPKCSIIIRAFNEEEHIARLLTGIVQQTIQPVEIILVDSGSTDATVAIAKRFPVKVVHIRPQDFTFGYSLNQGIAQATADFLVFASAHVYPVYPDWLENLLEPFENERVALTYGKQRGLQTSDFSENQIFLSWFSEESTNHQSNPFCNNANAAIRKSLWLKNPYDETLPGLEDLAWAQWAQDQGHEIAYVAEAEIIHVHRQNAKGVHNRYLREAMAFKQIYPQAVFGVREFLRLWISNTFVDLIAARKCGRLKKEWRSILSFRWQQFSGTYKGYRQSGDLTWKLKQAFYYPGNGTLQPQKKTRNVAPIAYTEQPVLSHEQEED